MELKRREFIAGLGIAVAWPVVARTQPQNPVRRIGVLFGTAKCRNNDQQIDLLTKSLQTLGWAEGKYIEIDYRWTKNDLAQIEILATELLERKPLNPALKLHAS